MSKLFDPTPVPNRTWPINSGEYSNDRSVTDPRPEGKPFEYPFMVPEQQDSYGSGTTFIRIPYDPTTIDRTFILETVVTYIVRFDESKLDSYLLERRLISDS